MAKTFKAILIDPVARTVTQETITNDGTLQPFYRLMRCELVEFAYKTAPAQSDVLVLDEEGFLKRGHQLFFINGRPFVGRAILVHMNLDETFATPVSLLEDVKAAVQFC